MLTIETREALMQMQAEYDLLAQKTPYTEVFTAAMNVRAAFERILRNDDDDNGAPELFAELDRATEQVRQLIAKLQSEKTEIKSGLSEESKEWLREKLMDTYLPAYDTVREFLDKNKNETAPSRTEVFNSIDAELNDVQVSFLRKMRRPTIYIVPETHAARLIEGINQPIFRKMSSDQQAPEISDRFKLQLNEEALHAGVDLNQSRITSYRFVIAEADIDRQILINDKAYDKNWNCNVLMPNKLRIQIFQEKTKGLGVRMLDPRAAMIAQAQSMRTMETMNVEHRLLTPMTDHGELAAGDCGYDRKIPGLEFLTAKMGDVEDKYRICPCVTGPITREVSFDKMNDSQLANYWRNIMAKKHGDKINHEKATNRKRFLDFLIFIGIDSSSNALALGYTQLAQAMNDIPHDIVK